MGEDHAGARVARSSWTTTRRPASTPYLEKLGFNLVGYGCTTCIGNSGPLPEEVSAAVHEDDLAVVSVLSGNRNFEGRINPDVKMNYLASPPLVIAYALAGTMDFDFDDRAARHRHRRAAASSCATSGPRRRRSQRRRRRRRSSQEMFTKDYADVFAGDERWRSLPTPTGDTFDWDADSTYVRKPPYFEGMGAGARPRSPTSPARGCWPSSATRSPPTTSARPARSRPDSPAGRYLTEHGVERKDFNSYGSRRGNHEVMIRGTFANIRLRNQLLDGVEGGFTRDFLQAGGRSRRTIYDAAQAYQAAGVPLVVLAGKEYGSGSSRDWAAKGTALLGVSAVIAESYERIHRSNLIGMGVLPLQFPAGETAESLGLDGTETFTISGRHRAQRGPHAADGRTSARPRPTAATVEFDAVRAHRHPRRGGLLPQRRHPAVRPATARAGLTGYRAQGCVRTANVQGYPWTGSPCPARASVTGPLPPRYRVELLVHPATNMLPHTTYPVMPLHAGRSAGCVSRPRDRGGVDAGARQNGPRGRT